jgi:hypothetical protein
MSNAVPSALAIIWMIDSGFVGSASWSGTSVETIELGEIHLDS